MSLFLVSLVHTLLHCCVHCLYDDWQGLGRLPAAVAARHPPRSLPLTLLQLQPLTTTQPNAPLQPLRRRSSRQARFGYAQMCRHRSSLFPRAVEMKRGSSSRGSRWRSNRPHRRAVDGRRQHPTLHKHHVPVMELRRETAGEAMRAAAAASAAALKGTLTTATNKLSRRKQTTTKMKTTKTKRTKPVTIRRIAKQ